MKRKNSSLLIAALGLCLMAPLALTSCESYDDYYVIDASSIRSEMLVNNDMALNPSFTNLGEKVDANYSIKILLEGEDVTSTVYNPATKIFHPTVIGSYTITFTVLNADGTVYVTKDGDTFSKTITVDVVMQSFAAKDTAGSDVTVSDTGVITFGSSYSEGSEEMIDSNQYKVTGVTFDGSYSITYELTNVQYDAVYSNPAFYFGWDDNRESNFDNCVKICSGNGVVSSWVWASNGDQADLSMNRTQGWTKGGWWDAPGSVSDYAPISGDHTVTFEKYVNDEKNIAVIGIQYDDQPFSYLNIGSNYTSFVKNVWIEAVNTSCSIRVSSFSNIEDKEAPKLDMNLEKTEHYLGDTINLYNLSTISDNSDYSSILIPSYAVYDSQNIECEVDGYNFTPTEVGTYKVVATIYDLAYNVTTVEKTLTILEPVKGDTEIDISETSSVALSNTGIILYYSATQDGQPVEFASIKCLDSNDEEYDYIYDYESKDGSVKFKYFLAPRGEYILEFTTVDGTKKTKDVSVNDKVSKVYGFEYYDLTSLVYKNAFVVGKNEILYIKYTSTRTAKIFPGLGKTLNNWTIEFDVTDLSFNGQGKLYITKNTLNPDGNNVGWEDLAIGGTKVGDEQRFYGYECSVYGTGWTSYEWVSTGVNGSNGTSVTQDTSFLPDPEDPSKGCGRAYTEYAKYLTGTHHYKMNCSMDEVSGVCTYRFYIDNELDVVHVTASDHDNANGMDFYQICVEKLQCYVNNITAY